MRRLSVLALALWLPACVVDTAIPADARLTCTRDDDCPGGWSCLDDRCRPAGWRPDAGPVDGVADAAPGEAGPDTSPARLDDRRTICGALYDKIKACPADVKATLGQDVWALVGDDREAFVETTCARDLLADASDGDLDAYLAQRSLLRAATCPFFVGVLCELFSADAGVATNCP